MLDMSRWGNPILDMSRYRGCTYKVTAKPPSRAEQIGKISSPRWFGVTSEAFPYCPPDLVKRTFLEVWIQIFFPFQGQGGEAT